MARVSLESTWLKPLGAGTVITAATGDGIDFVNGLGCGCHGGLPRADSSIPWAMTPWTLFSTTWVSQACGNCRGLSSSLSGIMQIVTSAVRVDVALTLSRRRSLFAPPNSCGTLVVLAHADAQSLCAAGACSLSEPWWLDQFTAQRQGTTAFSGLMRLRSSSYATSLIVTNRSRDSSVKFDQIPAPPSVGLQTVTATMTVTGVHMNRDGFRRVKQVGYSAPVWYGVPVGAAPTFQGAELSLQFVWLKQLCRG